MSRGLTLAAVLLLGVWIAAVRFGLGQALLGAGPSAASEVLLILPGALVALVLFAIAAWPRLARVAPAWRPGTPVAGLERHAERAPAPRPDPIDATPVAASVPPSAPPALTPLPIPPAAPEAVPALALVHLGPEADPAWAAWQLRWDADGHGHGAIPLPFGARVILGRDPRADLVVRLDQVSWHHLELDVREGEVLVTELGSTNGSRFEPAFQAAPQPLPAPFVQAAEPDRAPLPTTLVPRQPTRWTPRARLALASPTAITLTLEPLR